MNTAEAFPHATEHPVHEPHPHVHEAGEHDAHNHGLHDFHNHAHEGEQTPEQSHAIEAHEGCACPDCGPTSNEAIPSLKSNCCGVDGPHNHESHHDKKEAHGHGHGHNHGHHRPHASSSKNEQQHGHGDSHNPHQKTTAHGTSAHTKQAPEHRKTHHGTHIELNHKGCGPSCPEHSHPKATGPEYKPHVCHADCPEHSSRETAGHDHHVHTPTHPNHVHTKHGHPGHAHEASTPETTHQVKQDIHHAPYEAIRAAQERQYQNEQPEGEAMSRPTTETATQLEEPPLVERGQARENIATAVKTFPAEALAPAPEQTIAAREQAELATETRAKESFSDVVPSADAVHFPRTAPEAEQFEQTSLGPLSQADSAGHDAALGQENSVFAPDEETLHTQNVSVPSAPETPAAPSAEVAVVNLASSGEPVNIPELGRETANEITAAQPSIAELSSVDRPTMLSLPELPPLPVTLQSLPAEHSGTEAASVSSTETVVTQPPEQVSKELGQVVAETLGEALEKTIPASALNTETRTALAASLGRLQKLQEKTGEAHTTLLVQQEIVRLLGLLGYRDPAQTFGIYMQRYGEQFSQALLAHLLELLAQGRLYERILPTTPVQRSLPAARPSLGAVVLRLYRLGQLFRPALASAT